MKIQILNTTDRKYIGNIINYLGDVDNLYISTDIKIELIDVNINKPNIKLISMNYIIDGIIIEE